MTVDELIADLIEREGGFVTHPSDHGESTNHGITARTLGRCRGLGRPATVDEVKALSKWEAGQIYRAFYALPFEAVLADELRSQLVDFGVNSGVPTTIRALQAVLRVPVDGILGPRTLTALAAHDWRLVNNALVATRVKRLVWIVEQDQTQRAFLLGWLRRAVLFIA